MPGFNGLPRLFSSLPVGLLAHELTNETIYLALKVSEFTSISYGGPFELG
jgi:hypothetical protein